MTNWTDLENAVGQPLPGGGGSVSACGRGEAVRSRAREQATMSRRDTGSDESTGRSPCAFDGAVLGLFLLILACPISAQDLSPQLLNVKRVYVDRLTGGETAAQLRDLIITSLQNSKLFVLTENPDRADATIRGAAEDLIYTDDFQSSDSIDIHGGVASAARDGAYRTGPNSASPGNSESHSINLGAGEHESSNIKERKHEAFATIRLVNKDGDVIWSTTQESNGAKFHSASADVAEKISHQLTVEYERVRKLPVPPKPAP